MTGTADTATSPTRPRRPGAARGGRGRPRTTNRPSVRPRSRRRNGDNPNSGRGASGAFVPEHANRPKRRPRRRRGEPGALRTGGLPRPKKFSRRGNIGYSPDITGDTSGTGHWLNVSTFSYVVLRYLINTSRFLRRWLSYHTRTRSAKSRWSSSTSVLSMGESYSV